MIFVRSETLRNARANAHNSEFSGKKLRLYTGPMPVAGEAITTQTLLFEADIPTPAGTVGAGIFEMADLEELALDDGLAEFLRIADGGTSDFIMDCDAGAEGSGAAAIISPQNIYAGGLVRIRFKLTEP